MATPSSKYDVKSQITIGSGSTAFTVDATDTYRNLYPRANTEFDNSILYTKTVAKDVLNIGVPEIQGNTHTDYMKTDGDGGTEAWYASASGSTQYKVWDLTYNPYPKMGIDLGYTVVYKTTGSYGRYYWGKNEVVETTIANTNDMPIVRDWKYNELVFYLPIINVLEVSEVEDFVTNFTPGRTQVYPASKRVNLTELYNNPDKYYVLSFTTGAYIWNPKTEKYVANNNFQIMANIDTPNQSIGVTGIQNIVNLVKSQTFPYSGQSPYYVNLMFNATSTSQVAYGRNGFSEGIPKGLSTEYNYMLGYPSFEYKHTVIRNKIQQALDDITNSASGATTVSEYYIEIEKAHEDEKCVIYSYPYISGGTNADHSRQWLTTYQWKPIMFLKGSFFLKFIGSLGVYITIDPNPAMLTATPETLSNTPDVYLGEMNSKGFTTGRLIPWTDLDEYEGFNKDGSSVNPGFDPSGGGGGGDDEDDIDNIGLTLSTASNAAFRRMFALNSTELNQLEAALSGNYLEPLPSGFDPLQSVISLSVFPWDITNVNWIGCNTRANSEIVISGWQSGVTGNYVINHTSAFIEVGSFSVETHHNNFLDYAPYTTISVYVPYCGEIDIPTNLAMGQTVTVYLIYDIPSGSCEAVIKSSNGSILGTIAGDFSSGIEVTSSEAGLKKQAIITSGLNVVGQVANTAIGIAKDGPSAATGGIVGSLGAVSQSIASMNKNYTASIGATDGIVNFFKPDQCYIKITRPSVSLPSNYGHTTGYACNKTVKLGELVSGNYYVANNPDLSNSLGNEEEKQMLKAALENGFFK